MELIELSMRTLSFSLRLTTTGVSRSSRLLLCVWGGGGGGGGRGGETESEERRWRGGSRRGEVERRERDTREVEGYIKGRAKEGNMVV